METNPNPNPNDTGNSYAAGTQREQNPREATAPELGTRVSALQGDIDVLKDMVLELARRCEKQETTHQQHGLHRDLCEMWDRPRGPVVAEGAPVALPELGNATTIPAS